MKLAPLQDSPIDDGVLLQQVIKRGLIALSLAIIFLSSATLWTVLQLTDFYQNKVNLIAEQKHLLQVMRIAGHKRTLLMYKIATQKDPFLRDDHRMAFYSVGAKFAQARIKFIKSTLSDKELQMVNDQGVLTKANRPRQDEIVDLIINGEAKLALDILREKAIPEQNKVMHTLDRLSISIDKRNNEIKTKALEIGNATIIILISTVIIIILGAMYIFRRTTYRSSKIVFKLNNTRETLLKTLHELVQQQETLDHHAIVSIADRQGKITYVNDKFCETSGYTRDELIGKNHRLLKSDIHSQEYYKELWDTISQGNVWQGEICNKQKNGDYYWVESTISPFLDNTGIPYQFVSILTDITHVLEAKNKAEEANRSKTIFLSSMSHELRTPMNAVIGFAQLIDRATKDELTKQNIQEVINAGEHLLKLINEILDVSKIESGNIDIYIDSYEIKKIIEYCVAMIMTSADNMSIKIDNKITLLPDIKINIDERLFKQVVLNVLSNAVKYNKENGSLDINYTIENNKMLFLSIADTGKGIALNKQKNIFNPFDRAGEEGSSIAGTGLGLAISKKLIEKMNGTIEFESTEGVGSCFIIKVPIS